MFSYDYHVRFVFDYSNVGVNVVYDMNTSPDDATPEELSEAEDAVIELAIGLIAGDGIVLPDANEIDVELKGIFGGY